jgi:hypothetical protein
MKNDQEEIFQHPIKRCNDDDMQERMMKKRNLHESIEYFEYDKKEQ